MFPFTKSEKQRKPNLPNASLKISGTDIQVGIWRQDNELARPSYRFKLSKLSENGRRYSALKMDDVLLLPAVALRLCDVFLRAKLDEADRARFANMHGLLSELVKLHAEQERNGLFSNGETSHRGVLKS